MELKEGMYVRTNFGHIARISHLPDDLYLKIILDKNYLDEDGELNCGICEEDIKGKPSFDIIDLIEEGDYINGEKVIFVLKGCYAVFGENGRTTYKEDIKSVVTKEYFESGSYEVGD